MEDRHTSWTCRRVAYRSPTQVREVLMPGSDAISAEPDHLLREGQLVPDHS